MGKRFLRVNQFIDFCKEVGLHGVSSLELEEHEGRGWMYPAVRLIMPENYAQALWNYQLWDSYNVVIGSIPCDAATHFYHYWQVYELYQARREHKGMYQDYTQQFPKSLEFGDIQALLPFFDALSYFQHLYRSRYRQIVDPILPDADGYAAFDTQQQQDIEQSARDYATQTLAMYRLNERDLYNALKGMLYLYHRFEQSERYKLAEALKSDVWRMVELISFAFSTTSEAITDQIGYVGVGVSSQKTLEVLFPNRRKEVREKAKRILVSISTAYNRVAQNYQFSPQDVDELLNFVEETDLAVFEYALVELNETYFNKTSWYAAESFLRLKSLASFPESLLRTLISNSQDAAAQQRLNNSKREMYDVLTIAIQPIQPLVWKMYEADPNLRRAISTGDFQTKLSDLTDIFGSAATEVDFIGNSLILATLLRNFTSHHIVDKLDLLSGQYVYSVRGILNTTFFVWKIAKGRSWI